MALFYFNAKILSRSAGHSCIAAASYRSGARFQSERTGKIHNFRRKTEVQHSAIHVPDGSPSWTHDRSQLWNKSENSETRINAQLAREIVLGIPIELTPESRPALLDGFVREAFVSLGMIADYSIHDKPGNPHAHIMLTLREVSADGQGFGAKRRDWNNPGLVDKWRARWAEHANQMLAQQGHTVRIDHRSLADQGIAGPATVHVGRDNGLNSDAVQERKDFNALIMVQRELARIKDEERAIHEQLTRITSDIIDLETTLSEALAERDQQGSGATGAPASETPAGIVLPGDADFTLKPPISRRRPLRPRHQAAQIITTTTEATPTCSDF